MSDTVNVKGLSDLQKFLDQLPAKIERNIIRGALNAGAKPILDAAKANAPTARPSTENAKDRGGYHGALRDSLRISSKIANGRNILFDGQKVVVSVKAGGRKKDGADVYYAGWVEYGTRPHIIKARPGGKLYFGQAFYDFVMHPGAKARPFLRPAFDSQANAAIIASAEYIKKRLATKHGLDTADIAIEIEE